MGARLGVDIGGTFTDLVVVEDDGQILRKKVPSTVDNYADGILDAIAQAERNDGLNRGRVEEIVHGTTIATNAILEHKGARTGLITTKGFRDVLEIRRLAMPKLYNLPWQKPPVLVERFLRREVSERIAADGTVLVPLDPKEVVEVGRWLIEQGIESLALMFLNSYANRSHEEQAAAALRAAFPNIPVSVSVEIVPEILEFERVSTTVINAYVLPKVRHYVRSLGQDLSSVGISAPLLIMQSNGGMLPASAACESPVRIIESGPAAGVIGCRSLAARNGHTNVITFDMGGTTAKASLIENQAITQAAEYEVGGGVSMGTTMNRGGGYVLRVPSIDLAEVGAGGGSLVWFDKAGGIRVGPQSAGASPGPVCYMQGNEQPTVTDANLVLGYINPEGLAGGDLKVDIEAARAALTRKVAEPLGSKLLEAAHGIHMIANATMIRALRSVTTERGRDPADFVLYAFGGNGPIHAVNIARAMEVKTVVIPPSPGLFSAFGLLLAQIEQHSTRTFLHSLSDAAVSDLSHAFGELEKKARSRARDPEYPLQDPLIRRSLDLRLVGQSTELIVDLPEGSINQAVMDQAEATFYEKYEKAYGFRPQNEQIQIVNLRVTAAGTRPELASWANANDPGNGRESERMVYFGPEVGSKMTLVIQRKKLQEKPQPGPFIIEEYDSTTVIPPGCTAHLNTNSCIIITVQD
jgi:N-methylhydantoinase A